MIPSPSVAPDEAPAAVTRSRMQAEGREHVPGEVGIWVFIFGDMVSFGAFFAIFMIYRSGRVDLFTESQAELNIGCGTINTVLLLFSSLLVVSGVRRMRTVGPSVRAARFFLGAMACGVGFSAVKIFEWTTKFSQGISPRTNTFFELYFMMTGLHWLHLLVGLVFLSFLVRQSRRPALSVGDLRYTEGAACFWHMVDFLWIVLFPLLYLVQS